MSDAYIQWPTYKEEFQVVWSLKLNFEFSNPLSALITPISLTGKQNDGVETHLFVQWQRQTPLLPCNQLKY